MEIVEDLASNQGTNILPPSVRATACSLPTLICQGQTVKHSKTVAITNDTVATCWKQCNGGICCQS
jgi:hypothetical protein